MQKSRLAGILSLAVAMLSGCGGGADTSVAPQMQRARMSAAQAAETGSALTLPEIRGAYSIQKTDTGYSIKNNLSAEVKTVSPSLKRIQFADVSLSLDTETTGRIYRLYQAAFNRQPDLSGLGFWLEVVDRGTPLLSVASEFMASTEFQQLFGKNPTDTDFLSGLYNNVLHRNPDTAGLAFWLDVLKRGTSRAQVLLDFSESAENVAQVAPQIQDGVTYAQSGINYQPVANAGGDQQGKVFTAVNLDGADSSDANGDKLSYQWTLTKPTGSTATPSASNTSKLTFTPDVAGVYTAKLVVNDGKLSSVPDTVNIVVTAPVVATVPDTGRYTCSTITHAYALELFSQGHTYLDRDNDGKPCEATDLAVEATKATTPTTPSTGMCYVHGYTRKNGTYVKGYWRRC